MVLLDRISHKPLDHVAMQWTVLTLSPLDLIRTINFPFPLSRTISIASTHLLPVSVVAMPGLTTAQVSYLPYHSEGRGLREDARLMSIALQVTELSGINV